MVIANNNSDGIIKFLGLDISIRVFLYAMAALATIIFLILLSILLIMYIRKKMVVKGYLSLEEKEYQIEDKILQIEHEISKIQRKFYSHRVSTKINKKYLK